MSLQRGIVIAVLVVLAYIAKVVWAGYTSPLAKLPGPWYSRYTNLILRYQVLSGRRIFYVDKLHQQYGGVVRIAPNEAAVSDTGGVTQIHKIGGGFLKSDFYSVLVPTDTPGIFAMRDPHVHAARRRLFARAFSNSSLNSNWDVEVRQKVGLAVQKIRQDASGSSQGADIFKWWTLMTTDVIAHLCFGESFNMLELGKQTPYIDAIQAALLGSVLRSELPIVYNILRLIPLKRIQTMVTTDDVVYGYGRRAIENMRNRNGNAMNLFGQMLAACENNEKVSLTDKDIREEAGNLIVAGSDTSAVTLTYLVWAVLKQPDLQTRLEDEIAHLSDELTKEELENAPLLNSVIEETLRLYGAAPGALPRTVPKQGTTIGGYHIPGGAVVSTQAYTNHRDPSAFADPLRFDGLRFLNKPTLSAHQKASYMPFGGGSRVCIGIHLAYIELRLAAALFFRQCRGAKISECMKDEMMEMDNRFLISPVGHQCYITLK
ncbi:putative sterigmatocystin biosynthesis P450 monooxygenase [Alternaria arborescens]|uniref:Putative sterigmatocystin biosynthesis P450 monooxygenase n=1 Tax=Alternaria arborescens TaxID=156630 RepID=A0A4Q4SB40_9PLEO|nr:putative sterigmatocystin biosynthesis P450 monooxygenase [Alternaria arborescens]